MAQCSPEDIERLAYQARLGFSAEERLLLCTKINVVLAYVERVQELIQKYPDSVLHIEIANKLSSTRDDLIVPTETQPLLAQAPDQAGNCFVVPRIIEGSN